MKKSTKCLALLLALCMVFAFVLTACNNCSQHKDADGDGKCDNCGESLCNVHLDRTGEGVCQNCGALLCDHHKDLDSNGTCDNCGAIITICTVHVDVNGDKVCDNCGVSFVCAHKDANNDGICDKCSAQMPTVSNVTVTVTGDKSEIDLDGTVQLTVTVEGTSETGYIWSFSKENIVDIENNVLSVSNKDLKISTYVTVTATSIADTNASGSFSVLVKVPTKEGQVGELSSDMIAQIGNANITVTGVVTDVYIDNNYSYNSWTNEYPMTVKMTDGLWVGTWHGEGTEEISNLYGRGTEIVKNDKGETGNAMMEYYIDKNNQVTSKIVKNSWSIPTLWDTQHLWNHLGNLDIDNITYDAINEVYEYNINHSDYDELLFMTYLSFSLTPMLSDTLDELYFKVENGAITKLIAKTETITYPEDDENPDAIKYTQVELSFSNIGTTVVDLPCAYTSEGESNVALQSALTYMASLTSYAFQAVDTTTYAPSTDSSDYELESYTAPVSHSRIRKVALHGTNSAVGQVGLIGWITNDAALLCKTGKYTYSMDDKLYFSDYYGYKQIDEGHYDYFEEGYYKHDGITTPIYIGTRSYLGNFHDKLPAFQFAAELFTCVGQSQNPNTGVTTYSYKLLETAICRDIAMQLGIYYADSSEATLSSAFTITVEKDADGNCYIKQVKYPYSLTAGTYIGYVTVTFSGLNCTQMPTDNNGGDIFEEYEPRHIPETWSETETKYYSPNCSTLTSQTVTSDIAFRDAFGDKYDSSNFPQYKAFFNVFGDNIYGPFYDYTERDLNGDGKIDENDQDVDGNYSWKKILSINLSVENYDENSKITHEYFMQLVEALANELSVYGFVYDPANTDISGGTTGYGDKNYCFINVELGLQVRVWNNGTKNFSIYIYNMGDYIKK